MNEPAADSPAGLNGKLLASARRQLAALEAELDAARAKIAGLEDAFRLSRQHSGNLEELRAVLQGRIGELDQQCAHLTRVISTRDGAISQLQKSGAKLRSIEASFSWRATAPLRCLRRRLIDPWRRK